MFRATPDLNGWIQFLTSQKNHCYAFHVSYVSSLFILFLIILLVIFSLESPYGYLVDIPLFVLFFEIIILEIRLSPILYKSRFMLDKIMRGEIKDPKEIRERWFEK